MYFHFHCDDLGNDFLSNLFRCTSIKEVMHIERFAERIQFLKGEIEIKASGEVKIIQDVKKLLEMAAGIGTGSVRDYSEWV